MKLIYVASPYTHNKRTIRHKRFVDISNVCGKLTNKGVACISPISMNHPWHDHCDEAVETHWDYWRKFDTALLERCDELWVCMMEGWTESKGVAGEIQIAKEIGLPIRYLDPETLEVYDESAVISG